MERGGKPVLKRAAAKKASKLAAEQLGSSDDEFGAVTGAMKNQRPKRLPKPPRPSKSVSTISTKHKPASSAPHAPSSSQQSRPRALTQVSKIGPLPATALHSKKNVARSSVSADSDVEIVGFGFRSDPKPSCAAPSTLPHLRMPQTPSSKKRVLSHSGLSPGESLGSLSPLSSPEQLRGGISSQLDEPPSPVVEDWCLSDLGRLVWVRVDMSGDISERRYNSVWWPAQVIRTAPLRVLLFGKCPGSRAEGEDILVDNPSQLNVRSLANQFDVLQFNENNYGGASIGTRTSLFSPRKRQRVGDYDLHAQWEEARRLMLKEDARDNDGFPRFLSLMGREEGLFDSDPEEFTMELNQRVEEESWAPPPANFAYDIPGELILAKDKISSTQYWPAKIIEYVPPKHQKQRPRYKVLFFDHTVKDIPEDMFFTETQEGFATCKLGESEGNYGLDEEERDMDEAFEPVLIDEDEDALRADTPQPEIPPRIAFEALSIEEQFDYVKPVLVAVLQNRYEPARLRNEAFMCSAASRRSIVNGDQLSGNLTSYELEELDPLIRQWVRRRQMRQELGIIPPDTPSATGDSTEPPPPPPSTIGSEPDHIPFFDASSDDGATTDPLSEGSLPPSSFVSVVEDQDGQPAPSTPHPMRARNWSNHEQHSSAEHSTSPGEIASVTQEDHCSVTDGTDSRRPETSKNQPFARSFASLSEIDKITYCMTILMQEAKYQLLLWRHNLRHSLDLLPAPEEQRLHRLAEDKALESDWVHEIIRSRRAIEKTMLPTYQAKLKPMSRFRSGRD
ncbi:hypothetical protein BXZ70DRAFT_262674 [Cristinia sonorae]|uniref:PWWP domain-containing protein n=1 Tax=Cristinia sonorae TaxID=1940300 RepID=A0A8K0UYA7_9AGAR|nr:hypothetical protein BXZ70DRAFT_262674 [Cristinia sonorae]